MDIQDVREKNPEKLLREGFQKISFLALSPKLWVGGRQIFKFLCHVYMGYLTILRILFFHEHLGDRPMLRKVLNRRGGWEGSAVKDQVLKKSFFYAFPCLNLRKQNHKHRAELGTNKSENECI